MKNEYAEIIAFGSTQTALIQSYRNIFLTCQSILFAVAAFIASQGSPVSVLLSPIGVFLSVSWIVIDRHRGLDELFFDCHLLNKEKGIEISNVYNAYYDWGALSLKGKKDKISECPRGKDVLRVYGKLISTKGVIGTLLPSLFLLLWAILVYLVLFNKLPKPC